MPIPNAQERTFEDIINEMVAITDKYESLLNPQTGLPIIPRGLRYDLAIDGCSVYKTHEILETGEWVKLDEPILIWKNF